MINTDNKAVIPDNNITYDLTLQDKTYKCEFVIYTDTTGIDLERIGKYQSAWHVEDRIDTYVKQIYKDDIHVLFSPLDLKLKYNNKEYSIQSIIYTCMNNLYGVGYRGYKPTYDYSQFSDSANKKFRDDIALSGLKEFISLNLDAIRRKHITNFFQRQEDDLNKIMGALREAEIMLTHKRAVYNA